MAHLTRHVQVPSHFLLLCISALVFVTGCGTGATTNVLTFPNAYPSPKIAVAENLFTGNLSAYQVDATTGSFTEVSGSPVTTIPDTLGITLHPNAKWVYTASDSTSDIEGVAVDNTTGALTSIATASDSGAVPWPTAIGITADGKWLLTADCNSNISVFSIDQTSGALTAAAGSPFTVPGLGGSPCLGSITTVNNQFVYSGDENYTSANLVALAINDSTGALTPIGAPLTVPAPISTAAVDQSGLYYYAGAADGNLYGFAINQTTGALTQLGSSASATLTGGIAFGIVFDPQNRYVYAADGISSVDVFNFNILTGSLTAVTGSPFAAGTFPSSARVDPSGEFLYVTDYTAREILGYKLDQATGIPTPLDNFPLLSSGSGTASLVITH